MSHDKRDPHFSKPAKQEVKVRDYLSKLVSAEHSVDQLHLLCVSKEVPVIQGQVGRNLA